MGLVQGLNFYLGPQLPGPLRPAKMLDDDGSLCQMFRGAILKSQDLFTVRLKVAPHPEVVCSFIKCGQTAGLAHWGYGEATQAVTAYLCGLDKQDEGLVASTLATKPFPITLHLWQQVLAAKRPIYATFYVTPASFDDRVIATAAPGLANSFFSTLGVT